MHILFFVASGFAVERGPTCFESATTTSLIPRGLRCYQKHAGCRCKAPPLPQAVQPRHMGRFFCKNTKSLVGIMYTTTSTHAHVPQPIVLLRCTTKAHPRTPRSAFFSTRCCPSVRTKRQAGYTELRALSTTPLHEVHDAACTCTHPSPCNHLWGFNPTYFVLWGNTRKHHRPALSV